MRSTLVCSVLFHILRKQNISLNNHYYCAYVRSKYEQSVNNPVKFP